MRPGAVFFALAVLMILPVVAAAEPKPLSDEELGQITARGEDQLNLSFNPDDGGLNFSFNLGSVLGNGSVVSSPFTGASNLAVSGGNINLSNSTFVVDHMTFNLNACVMCTATTINQLGFGLGVTIKP